MLSVALPIGVVLCGEPAQAQTVAALGRMQVDPRVMASHCLTQVSPMYPQITPLPDPVTVVLQILVTRRGMVQPIDVISGPQAFQDAARSAVRLWRYQPYLRDGAPVDVITQATVLFMPGAPGGMISHPGH